ncbi:MAG: universal stress protein [Dehalococcoidia bacterium]
MKILVPLDGSPLAEAALPIAEELARNAQGTIVLLTVGELPETGEHRLEEEAALRRIVDGAALRLEPAPVHTLVDMGGDPVAAIVRCAQEEGIDQIVMSTHGHTGSPLRTHGTVADGVMRHSSVPVTLVRPTREQLEGERALTENLDCDEFADRARRQVQEGGSLSPSELERLRSCLDDLPARKQLPVAETYLAALRLEERGPAVVDFIEFGPAAAREAALMIAEDLDTSVIPELTRVAHESEGERQWAAYQAIRRIGGEAAIEPLLHVLSSDRIELRWVASDGLFEIGTPAVVALLRMIATSAPSLTVHRAARRVLRRAPLVGHEAARDRLVESLAPETTIVQSPTLAQELLRELELDGVPTA